MLGLNLAMSFDKTRTRAFQFIIRRLLPIFFSYNLIYYFLTLGSSFHPSFAPFFRYPFYQISSFTDSSRVLCIYSYLNSVYILQFMFYFRIYSTCFFWRSIFSLSLSSLIISSLLLVSIIAIALLASYLCVYIFHLYILLAIIQSFHSLIYAVRVIIRYLTMWLTFIQFFFYAYFIPCWRHEHLPTRR